MGFWGTSIFDNDYVLDIMETYLELLKAGSSDIEAYDLILEQNNEVIGTDEEPLLWYALADIQWKIGRLQPNVKDSALCFIKQNGGLSLLEGNTKYEHNWKSSLKKLEIEITSPMPSMKVFLKPVEFERNPWDIGDIYVYAFKTRNPNSLFFHKYIAIQKITEEENYDCNCTIPRIQVYNKLFDEIPTIEAIKSASILPLDNPERFFSKGNILELPLILNAPIEIYEKKDYPYKRLVYIGNSSFESQYPKVDARWSSVSWNTLDICLMDYYMSWMNYEFIYDGKHFYLSNAKDNIEIVI